VIVTTRVPITRGPLNSAQIFQQLQVPWSQLTFYFVSENVLFCTIFFVSLSHSTNSFVIGPAGIKHTHVLHSPPPPREQLCNRSCSNKTHTGMVPHKVFPPRAKLCNRSCSNKHTHSFIPPCIAPPSSSILSPVTLARRRITNSHVPTRITLFHSYILP
jgi:hypothetical protein